MHPPNLDRVNQWMAKPSTVRRFVVAAILTLAVFVLWLLVQVLVLSQDARESAADRVALRTANARQDDALAEANRRLTEAGKAPVQVPATPTPTVEGPQGIPGLPGLQGPAGADGRDGQDATPAMVASAVNAWCSTRDDCTGPAGPAGPDGAPGKDGATGPVGPQGEKGDTGATGKDGADSTVPGPAGPTGPAGADGKDGAPGKDAYPFTFTFVVQNNPVQSTTYTCTVMDPATPATCTSS